MLFGNYADKRELQKVFETNLITIPAPGRGARRGRGPLVRLHRRRRRRLRRDLHRGRPASGQDTLRVDGYDGELPRGKLLVLGGDEVYPRASTKAYDDRTVGPYRSAMPRATPQPLMLALPGNHDWYDGLTSFLRLFTQDRMIGGWRTEQKRSYFTVQLPHRWWLVGLDSQLDSYFDDPQLKYFEETLTAHLQPGDSVIVCAATPAWLKASSGHPDAFNGLEWFERNFVTSRKVGEGKEPELDRRPGPALAQRRQAPLHEVRRGARGRRVPRDRTPDGDLRARRRLPRHHARARHRAQAAARRRPATGARATATRRSSSSPPPTRPSTTRAPG